MRTIRFELEAYPGDDDGDIAERAVRSEEDLPGPTEAKRFAGRLAAKIKGPVDLFYAGDEHPKERYITTAAPCQFAKAGYRMERLDA